MSTVTTLGMNIISRYDRAGMLAARRDMATTGTAASKLGKALKTGLAIGAVAVAAVGYEAVKSSIDFQKSMTQIQTQANVSAKGVAVLSKQVLAMKGAQQGPKELADSLLHLKLLGMDSGNAIKALRVSSDLAAVSGSHLEETTNALGGAWRTGIKGATNFKMAAATAFSVISAGNATMDDFIDFLGTGILPSAKTFGLSLQSVGAAMALFTDEGVSASSAGTRLRMTISLMGAPSEKAAKQLAKIGLTGTVLANDMRSPGGLVAAVGDLKKHLDDSGLSATGAAQLLSRAFGGGRSSSAILSMINNFDVLKMKQDQVNKGISKYGPAVEVQKKTAAAQIAKLKAAWQTLMVQIGNSGLLNLATNSLDGLNSALSGTAGFINNTAMPAFHSFREILSNLIPTKSIESGLSKIKTDIGSFISGLAKNSGISGIWDALTKPKLKPLPDDNFMNTPMGNSGLSKSPYGNAGVSTVGKSTTQGLANSPYGNSGVSRNKAPKTATQGLAKSPYGNSNISTVAKSTMQGLSKSPYGNSSVSRNKIPATASRGLSQSPYGNAAVAAKQKSAPPKPKSQNKIIADNIVSIFQNLDYAKIGDMLGKMIGKAFTYLTSHAKDLSKKASDVISSIDWVNVGKSLGSIAIPMAIGIINNLFDPLFSLDFWKKHWLDTILAVLAVIPFGKVFGIVEKLASKVPWGKLGEVFAKAFGKIPWGKIFTLGGKIKWGSIFGKIGDIASKVFDVLKRVFSASFISKIGTWIGKQFAKLGDWIIKEVKLLPIRIGVWFLKIGDWITQKVPGMGSGIIKAFVKFFAKFSLYQSGKNLIIGLFNGITNFFAGIGKWIKSHIIDPFISNFDSLFGIHSPSTVMFDRGKNIALGLLNGIAGFAIGIGKWVKGHVVDPFMSQFSTVNHWLLSKGKSIVNGLKNGILSGIKAIGNWEITHVINPTLNAWARASSWLLSKGKAIVTGMKNGVLTGAKAIGSWAGTHVVTPFKNAFSKAKTWLTSAGKNVISGFKSGITTGLGKAKDWVSAHLYNPIKNAVIDLFKIASPSKVMKTLGGHVVNGFLEPLLKTNIQDVITNTFGSLPNAFKTLFQDGLIHVEDFTSGTMKKLSSIGGSIGGFFSGIFGGGGGNGGKGVQRWKPYVQAVLSLLGQPLSWTDTVLRRMNQESGGNPNIVNHWDSNAKAGHPSQGLMQTIPSTFNAYAGPYRSAGILDPFANIYAGLNYALNRYGSLSALNRPGGYANGTPGASRGWHMVGERGPELMYTRGGEKVIPNHRAVDTSGGGTQEVHFHFEGASFNGTSKKEFQNLMIGALRDAQRTGRVKKGTVNQ